MLCGGEGLALLVQTDHTGCKAVLLASVHPHGHACTCTWAEWGFVPGQAARVFGSFPGNSGTWEMSHSHCLRMLFSICPAALRAERRLASTSDVPRRNLCPGPEPSCSSGGAFPPTCLPCCINIETGWQNKATNKETLESRELISTGGNPSVI